jgi:hypothetical protein
MSDNIPPQQGITDIPKFTVEDGKSINITFSISNEQLNKIDWMDNYLMEREKIIAKQGETTRDKSNRSLIVRIAIDNLWDSVMEAIINERRRLHNAEES